MIRHPVTRPAMATPDPIGTPIRKLDLNLLRVLVAIYDANGVTAARARLHLTQPAISNALTRLRDALGDELFVRSSRGFVATAYVERVLPIIRDALSSLSEALETRPVFEPRHSTRWFRVAMTDAGEMVFVPKLIRRLAGDAPGVRLEIVPLTFDSLAQALADGIVDAAIGPLPASSSADLQMTALFSEHYVGLVRSGGALHRAAGARARLTSTAMRSAPLVIVAQAQTLHQRIVDVIEAEGLGGNVIGRVPHFMAVPALVAAYDALAIVPSEIATIFAQRGLGVALALPLPLAAYEVTLARHRRFERDPGLLWFSTLAVDVLTTRSGLSTPRSSARGRRLRS
jgi:DNA-binding transcriptional LysR family regulator